ncbi:MAG: hypothetical protein ACYC26_00130 [Phycisphaerales bacterium]
MGLRDKINANQNAVVVVAVVIIAVAFIWIFYMSGLVGGRGGPAGSGKAWFYDTVKKTYFKDKADQFPPITSPDGNPAVRAHFFSCGDCDREKERFPGFYDKYTADAKAKLEAARKAQKPEEMAGMEMYYETGVLYSIDGEHWYAPSSMEYQEALQKALNCPKGGRAKYCRVK